MFSHADKDVSKINVFDHVENVYHMQVIVFMGVVIET